MNIWTLFAELFAGHSLSVSYRAANPPTLAHAYGPQWDQERRIRQHRPFEIDRADLFTHGIDGVKE